MQQAAHLRCQRHSRAGSRSAHTRTDAVQSYLSEAGQSLTELADEAVTGVRGMMGGFLKLRRLIPSSGKQMQ